MNFFSQRVKNPIQLEMEDPAQKCYSDCGNTYSTCIDSGEKSVRDCRQAQKACMEKCEDEEEVYHACLNQCDPLNEDEKPQCIQDCKAKR